MSQTSISVWFVCKLCRGSFRQVDDFIEHKKEEHFTDFQNTSCIVFEERVLCPELTNNEDPQPVDEIMEPTIKIEVKEDDPVIPFSSEISDEPNFDLVEPKSEQIIFESEVEVQKSEMQPTATLINISTDHNNVQFECQLCSKQLESDAQLQIHVGICALYHKDRNRFCVTCNKKLYNAISFQNHCVSFHESEEKEFYKFKCRLCPQQYQNARDLRNHLDCHKDKKHLNISRSPKPKQPKTFKCSKSNCGKEFNDKHDLLRHTATHFDLRPSAVRIRIVTKNACKEDS